MKFSAQVTGDPDLSYQITEQIVKDLAKLHLGRGLDYDYKTCHHGMTPFSIIPLSQEAHRERESEERARAQATQTTVQDHRKKRKYVPKLVLTYEALRMLMKCWRFWLLELLGERSKYAKRVKKLEQTFLKHYMHVQYLDPETILSILWTLFLDARIFFGTAVSKANLQDPRGIRPDCPSMNGLIENMRGSFIGRRDNIPWEWRREYLQNRPNNPTSGQPSDPSHQNGSATPAGGRGRSGRAEI